MLLLRVRSALLPVSAHFNRNPFAFANVLPLPSGFRLPVRFAQQQPAARELLRFSF
ncbi:hypothetical protein [Methanimicrococcus hongohii]|uniref:hypothetical protein n=1 Tax=Methanimicrococcus hongohii TaxID=3028295 RepID=UPI00292DFE45|nr:hypothetical protein [Methanimicrococcus sp. Hf6]